MATLLATCGGFLLAVLWMDLMFDVQALKFAPKGEVLPENVLASIAGYYRRVTTEARPMNLLIAVVMLTTVGGCLAQLFLGSEPLWIVGAGLALSGVPITLARLRVIRNAVRLGARSDDAKTQSELARSICRDHLACFTAIVLFIGLQISAAII